MSKKQKVYISSILIAIGMLLFTACGKSVQMDVGEVETTESAEKEYYVFRELPEAIYIKAAEAFSGGSGAENDPYLIATIEELALLSNLMENEDIKNEYSHAYYELITDITLNEGEASLWRDKPPKYSWKTIGTNAFTRFEGHFNGNGHTISGIYINVDESESVERGYGLFGILHGGVIENLNITNSYMCLSGYTNDFGGVVGKISKAVVSNCSVNAYIDFYDADCGGIVGHNAGGHNGDDSKVINCTFSGEIRALRERSYSNIGGIVGLNNNNAIIKNCVNNGSLCMQAEGAAYSGGIVGWFGGGNVADCQNNGLLSGAVYVGGVAGHIRSSNIGGELKNDEIFLEGCRNQGEITSAGVSAGIAAHVSNDGGKPIHIKNCENAEILEAYGTVGGIIGDGISAGVGVFIEGCTNIADLSAQKAGGIIGNLTGYTGTFSLRNCRNEGNVMATEKSAGGMIGEYYTYFDTAAEIKIENCMNIGKIEAAGDAGGIIGMLMGHASSFSENACINVTKCENTGDIYTYSDSNVSIGGIIGTYGLRGSAAKIYDCKNTGNLNVTKNESSNGLAEEPFKISRICGGIVGRVGEAAYIFTDLDRVNTENINTEDALIVFEDCFSSGNFVVPDENESNRNLVGGVIGNCSAEDEYTVNVINCTYKNAERGLGGDYLPDVGTRID